MKVSYHRTCEVMADSDMVDASIGVVVKEERCTRSV